MRRLIAWFGRSVSWSLRNSPLWVRSFLGSCIGFLWFDFFRIRRQIVLENIARAFPHLTRAERVRLGRRSMHLFGRNIVDYCHLPFLTKDNIDSLVTIENLELLDEALRSGRGVMLLTLHLGHGDIACSALSLKGYPMFVVSKLFKTEWLNDMWFGMRRRTGTEFIPPRNSTFALLKALKRGGIVALPLDQFTGPPIGVRTKFFGIETGTAAGFALMAHRSQAKVLSVYTIRTAEGRHLLRFVRELPVPLKEGDDQSLIDVTQSFNDELEKFVRAHPEHWMWVHRRWKRFVVHS